jgi:adenine-specific DNA-methyltransferase
MAPQLRGDEMATGVPKKRSGRTTPSPGDEARAFRLEYPGKRSIAEILATPTDDCATIWRGREEASNRLYFADNLSILAGLRNEPTFAGRVRLVYIDPPYATETIFHSRSLNPAYDDTLAGPEYLEALRQRIILIRELLADDGSLYLHLDEKMVFHAKLILDEVFGPSQYRNCITRKKCNPKNYTRKAYGKVADYILFYTKTGNYVWNRPTEPWTPERAKEYQYVEPETGRRFMKVPIHAPGVRNGETGQPWRGKQPPPGKHWQYPPQVLDELDARGEIYWSPSGNPRRKVYLDENPGVGVQDIWLGFRDAHNQNIRITGYPTEKNSDLLRRLISASSNAGDLMLDCYAGSGTTLAVAAELGRSWVGVDRSPEAIATILDRFTRGLQPMGDFIDRQGAESAPAVQQMLFDAADTTDKSLPSMEKAVPLDSFDFFADRILLHTHATTVAKWRDRLAENL